MTKRPLSASPSRIQLRPKTKRKRPLPKETHRKRTPAEQARKAHQKATASTSLQLLQQKLHRWEVRNFGNSPYVNHALGVSEETGELAEAVLHHLATFQSLQRSLLNIGAGAGKLSHAVLKHAQRIRGMGDEALLREKAGDAIADITIFAMNLCSNLGLDYETLVRETARDVMKRDWRKNPSGPHS